MNKVYSLNEAREWFLTHSSESLLCVCGDASYVCFCYLDAVEFYTGKSVLDLN